MTIALTILIDPIHLLNPATDSSLALLAYAFKLNWKITLVYPQDLWLTNGIPWGNGHQVESINAKTNLPTLQTAKP